MSQPPAFASLPANQATERLRTHGKLLTGYALALARRAGLQPADAAALFIEPLLAGAPPIDDTAAHHGMHRWLELEAAAMEAVHGTAILEQDGETGTIVIDITEDLAWLRLWDVPVEYWTDWMAAHIGRVAARHAVTVQVHHDGERLRLAFRRP